jgi:hypothetical protein
MKVDLYYAKKRKARENEAQIDINIEMTVDCPGQNVNSCGKVVALTETTTATHNEQLTKVIKPAEGNAGEPNPFFSQLEEEIEENEDFKEI